MYGSYSKLYSEWCECYDPKGIELSIIEKYFSLENKDILDVGCGTGRFLFRVLPIAKSVIGIDNDIDSIDVLKQLMLEKYSCFSNRAFIYCKDIQKCNIGKEIVDLSVFSWSFYALNNEQMVNSLLNISEMLREDGMLLILQPVGGEFEEVMRKFFEEHIDMDEYSTALSLMDDVTSSLYTLVATDKIISEFVVKDLEMFCNALKMFAVTEGECSEDALAQITMDKVKNIVDVYKQNDGYHLSDVVDVFVYKKRK